MSQLASHIPKYNYLWVILVIILLAKMGAS